MAAKIKKKTVKLPDADRDEMAKMFNEMISGSTDLNVIYPRYTNFAGHLGKICDILGKFGDSPIFRIPAFMEARGDLIAFIVETRRAIICPVVVDAAIIDYAAIPAEAQSVIISHYRGLKDHKNVAHLIATCAELIKCKKEINKEDVRIITAAAGTEWAPLTFCPVNLRRLVQFNVPAGVFTFILGFLHTLLDLLLELYELKTSPDIDIDKFAETMMKSLDSVQKLPQLSRCTHAFAKLRESVGMLKSGFGKYYRDFIETRDATVILQNYILDVSGTMKDDIKMMREFKMITAYFADVAKKNNAQNPQLKSLFDKVSESFSALDSRGKDMVEIESEIDSTSQAAVSRADSTSQAAVSRADPK